jgi:hypothetical protein
MLTLVLVLRSLRSIRLSEDADAAHAERVRAKLCLTSRQRPMNLVHLTNSDTRVWSGSSESCTCYAAVLLTPRSHISRTAMRAACAADRSSTYFQSPQSEICGHTKPSKFIRRIRPCHALHCPDYCTESHPLHRRTLQATERSPNTICIVSSVKPAALSRQPCEPNGIEWSPHLTLPPGVLIFRSCRGVAPDRRSEPGPCRREVRSMGAWP